MNKLEKKFNGNFKKKKRERVNPYLLNLRAGESGWEYRRNEIGHVLTHVGTLESILPTFVYV